MPILSLFLHLTAVLLWAIHQSVMQALVLYVISILFLYFISNPLDRFLFVLAVFFLTLYVTLGIEPRSMTLTNSDDLIYHKIAQTVSITIPLSAQLQPWKLDYIFDVAMNEGLLVPNLGYFKILGLLYTIVPINQSDIHLAGIYFNIFSYFFMIFLLLSVTSERIVNSFFSIRTLLFIAIVASPALLQTTVLLHKDDTVFLLLVATIILLLNDKIKWALLVGALLSSMRIAYFPIVSILCITYLFHSIPATEGRHGNIISRAIIWTECGFLLILIFIPKISEFFLPLGSLENMLILESKLGRTQALLNNSIGRVIYTHINQFPDGALVIVGQIWTWLYFLTLIIAMPSMLYVLWIGYTQKKLKSDIILICYLFLFLASLIVCIQSVVTGLYFLNEPRYHIVLYIVGFLMIGVIKGQSVVAGDLEVMSETP